MRRKFHVRFGGGPGEKVEHSNLARGLPCDAAVKIVLAGGVELQPDGTARIASQSNAQVVYRLVNDECSCKDYPRAPSHWCKHVRFVHPKLAA
jgi:hypothetical protein